MPSYIVSYLVSCSGTVHIEASSEEEAQELAEKMPLSELGREADEATVEVVEVTSP